MIEKCGLPYKLKSRIQVDKYTQTNISQGCLRSGGHYRLTTAMINSSSIPPPSMPKPNGTIQLAASCSYIHLLPNWPLSRSGDQVLAMTTAAQSETAPCWHHNYTASHPTWALGSKLSEQTDKEAKEGGRGYERMRNRWRGEKKRGGGEKTADWRLVQPWD